MINDTLPTVPYVNSQLLPSKKGRSVRLVCRVDGVSPDGLKAKVEAADHGSVIVNRAPGSKPYSTQFVVITGTVNDDLSITEEFQESFGSTFGIYQIIFHFYVSTFASLV